MNRSLRSVLVACLVSTVLPSLCLSQPVDGAFPFQSDTAKRYSLYIPSMYDASTPAPMMVAFHPLNTARWDSRSWRDTLIRFAETNGLVLVCPDGGLDGMVDDPIDTAFTTALLDSVRARYSIDRRRTYAMGFSWGGRTTYTYGLSHAESFGGFLPIGAAISGTTEVTPQLQATAVGKPVYIVHGGADIPDERYYPVRQGLEHAGAVVASLLMPGIGHTIDFPNRNEILTTAFRWIDSVNRNGSTSGVESRGGSLDRFDLVPNPVGRGEVVRLVGRAIGARALAIDLVDCAGRSVSVGPFLRSDAGDSESVGIGTRGMAPGLYVVRVEGVGAISSAMLRILP
jgi:poly(3-hydroxybutyrate) depolymerase